MADLRASGLLVAIVLLSSLGFCIGAGKTVTIPLARATTQSAGQLEQPVTNYFTTVEIGTPPRAFKVQFDVNSKDLFVPHYSWNPFKVNLNYRSGYQCKVSSSCIKNDRQMVIDYSHCKLTGKPYEDVMNFVSGYSSSPSEGPIRFRQNFLAISDASDARFKNQPIDGVFGLGLSAQSPATVHNMLLNMHQAKLIDNIQFGFWFNPVLDSNLGGELTIGGSDTSRYQGQIFWHRVLSQASERWSIGLQHVMLGGQVISCAGQQCQATLSTGVNEIYGPREDVQKIYNLLNTSHQSAGLEFIDCRRLPNLPTITFTIDGIPYSLLPSNYIRKMVNGRLMKEENCYVGILPSDDSKSDWVLGTNFLGAYYSIFDITYKQVGFASLK